MDKKKKKEGSQMKSTIHERCGSFPENLLSVLFVVTTKQAMTAFDWPTGKRIREG